MATIPCSIVEYVHYSRAIEEEKYYALVISIFLHDTCTLMLDVPRVGKRMNKAHVLDERVEEHRFPTTEKEQGTSQWSVCKEPCAFPLFFAACPPINN